MAQETWGELEELNQKTSSTGKKKQKSKKKSQAGPRGEVKKKTPEKKNIKGHGKNQKKSHKEPEDTAINWSVDDGGLDESTEEETSDEWSKSDEQEEETSDVLDKEREGGKSDTQKKHLKAAPKKKSKKGTKKAKAKKVTGVKHGTRKESEEWKKQAKKYKSTKKRTKILGIIIVLLLILATVLGYVYYFQIDTDGDGKPDVSDSDDDNDDIPDYWEEDYGLDPKDSGDAYKDKDKDGLKNYFEFKTGSNPLVKDTDSDGLWDGVEWNIGTKPNNPDSDHDGMPDGWEDDHNLNPNYDDANFDNDQDGYDANQNGILEKDEYYTNLDEYINDTDPISVDTDSDGMWDGWEKRFYLDPVYPGDAELDTDDDGLTNLQEFINKTNPIKSDTDRDTLTDYDEIVKYATDPLNFDTDGDGLWDGWEIRYGGASVGLNPKSRDSDGDGITDEFEDLDNDNLDNKIEHFEEIDTSPVLWDTDGDGISDGWEVNHSCLDPRIPNADLDTDLDGLSNLAEFENGTDPCEQDTDGDGLTDTQELLEGFNGMVIDGKYVVDSSVPRYFTNATKLDTDGDGLNDSDEILIFNTNASNVDSDGDGISDDEEIVGGSDGFVTNPISVDTDNDKLNDWLEIYTWATKPTVPDTDGDGLLDGLEVLVDYKPFSAGLDTTDPHNNDTDGDGMADGWEAHLGFASRDLKLPNNKMTVIEYYDQRYGTNYFSQLMKNSSITGVWLVNPLNFEDKFEDADYDGYDSTGDGKIDTFEEYNNSNEYTQNTNPVNWDTDGDGMSDGWELEFKEHVPSLGREAPDPTIPDGNIDNEGDGIIYYVNKVKYLDDFDNLDEYRTGKDLNNDGIIEYGTTDPNDPSTNNNPFYNDYQEIWYGDDDNDSLYNGWELLFNDLLLDPGDFSPRFYPDFDRYNNSYNPKNNDSDDDGIDDGDEDYDRDGWTNKQEQANVRNPPSGSSDPTDPDMTPLTIQRRSVPGARSGNKFKDGARHERKNDHLSIKSNPHGNIYTENIYVNYQIIVYCDNIKKCDQFIQSSPFLAASCSEPFVCVGGTRW